MVTVTAAFFCAIFYCWLVGTITKPHHHRTYMHKHLCIYLRILLPHLQCVYMRPLQTHSYYTPEALTQYQNIQHWWRVSVQCPDQTVVQNCCRLLTLCKWHLGVKTLFENPAIQGEVVKDYQVEICERCEWLCKYYTLWVCDFNNAIQTSYLK